MLNTFARIIVVGLLLSCNAMAAEPIKIGFIDPLSGAFAHTGDNAIKSYQSVIDNINAKGGVLNGRKFELVAYDNKNSAEQTSQAIQILRDQGVRFLVSGLNSATGAVIIDAANKQYSRYPQEPLLFLNWGSRDPEFTNSKCSFWHFRFDSDSDMQMAALTSYMAADPKIKKVYLIGPDYSYGQTIAKAARQFLKEKRPDIAIVGDQFFPLGRVKDFSPYIAKIQDSGADSVITPNFGSDLALLIRAAKDYGLSSRFFALNAGGSGAPTAIGEAGVGRVTWLSEWQNNIVPNKTEKFADDFKKRYGQDFIFFRIKTQMDVFAKAIDVAQSTDPIKVARALEGLHFEGDTGEVQMRAADHQLIVPIFISTFAKAGTPGVKQDLENTGFGYRVDARLEGSASTLPTSCKMKRP